MESKFLQNIMIFYDLMCLLIFCLARLKVNLFTVIGINLFDVDISSFIINQVISTLRKWRFSIKCTWLDTFRPAFESNQRILSECLSVVPLGFLDTFTLRGIEDCSLRVYVVLSDYFTFCRLDPLVFVACHEHKHIEFHIIILNRPW